MLPGTVDGAVSLNLADFRSVGRTGLEPYPLQPTLFPPVAFSDVALQHIRGFVASVDLKAIARQLLRSRAGRVAPRSEWPLNRAAVALASLRV